MVSGARAGSRSTSLWRAVIGESGLLGRWSVTPAGAPGGVAGRASGEVLSARGPSVRGAVGGCNRQPSSGLAFRRALRHTRAVEVSDSDPHAHASEAGDQMHSELDAIQERLRALKRKLDARRSVVVIEEDIARGDAVEMNPLTASNSEPPAG